MRRFTKNMVVAAVAVATAVAILVSCKKEKNEGTVVRFNSSEVNILLNRIKSFKHLRETVNAGAKTNGSMTVEEMRQILDLTSNYEHSEHMTYCVNTVLDTLHVTMPAIDGEGNVSETDVVATYNAFETALEECMLAVNDGREVPSKFSIVMPDSNAKDDEDIAIVFTRGEASEDSLTNDYPFSQGDDRIWGRDLGMCDPIGLNCTSDAADKLTECFTFDRTPPQEGMVLILTNTHYVTYTVYYKPPFDWYYWDPIVTTPCTDHWLFYYVGPVTDEPCITWEELNCYWSNINSEVVNPTAPLHYHTSWMITAPYFEGLVEDRIIEGPNSNIETKLHNFRVTYSEYYWYTPGI